MQCPAAMVHYQDFMGGVDRNDQLRQYYYVRLKCRIFFRYIFFSFCGCHSKYLHSTHTHYSSKAWQPLKEFRLELAKGLVGEYHSKERHNRHHAPSTKLSILHFQSKVSNDTTGVAICSRCWFYFNNKRLQQLRNTPWYCHECPLYFCHTGVPETNFFPLFHTK